MLEREKPSLKFTISNSIIHRNVIFTLLRFRLFSLSSPLTRNQHLPRASVGKFKILIWFIRRRNHSKYYGNSRWTFCAPSVKYLSLSSRTLLPLTPCSHSLRRSRLVGFLFYCAEFPFGFNVSISKIPPTTRLIVIHRYFVYICVSARESLKRGKKGR